MIVLNFEFLSKQAHACQNELFTIHLKGQCQTETNKKKTKDTSKAFF